MADSPRESSFGPTKASVELHEKVLGRDALACKALDLVVWLVGHDQANDAAARNSVIGNMMTYSDNE